MRALRYFMFPVIVDWCRPPADEVALNSCGGTRSADDGEPFDSVPAAADAYGASVAQAGP